MAKTTKGRIVPLLAVAAVVVFALSGWFWWHNVRSNPKRVFEAMLANNLKTTAVTDHVMQSTDPQQLDQTLQLMASPANTVHANTTLSQTGDSAASVITETIGNPFSDYVRYLDIVSTQKDASGHELDFSKVKGVWGKTTGVDDTQGQTTGELYNQTILGVVPFGNLPANQRKQLYDQIIGQNVYSPDYSKVKHEIKNGRPVYTYDVTVKPEPYVSMLKTFGHDLGLSQLESVDPASYSTAPALQFQLTIDVWTRQLTSVIYTNGARVESLSGFGVERPVKLPTDSVSIEELQSRVQSLQ